MVARIISVCSLVCCGLVLASFALFATGQASGASKSQVAQLGASTAGPGGQHAVKPQPAQPRRFIDGAARVLTSPFTSVVHADSLWAVRIATTLLALLAYGLGLGYLARYART